MIYVLAAIEVREGTRDAFLEQFKANVPNVLAEQGCLGYEPTVDLASGLDAQGPVRDNLVTIVEMWEDLDALNAHLAAPHMATYRERVKDMVRGVTLKVLQPA
jgi:quinol monooxygenase YgiN